VLAAAIQSRYYLLFLQQYFALKAITRPAVQEGSALSVIALEKDGTETVMKNTGKVSPVVATLFVVVGLATSRPVSEQQKTQHGHPHAR
jgi:hypothetical protein